MRTLRQYIPALPIALFVKNGFDATKLRRSASWLSS
jgi:hypothetical protein